MPRRLTARSLSSLRIASAASASAAAASLESTGFDTGTAMLRGLLSESENTEPTCERARVRAAGVGDDSEGIGRRERLAEETTDVMLEEGGRGDIVTWWWPPAWWW